MSNKKILVTRKTKETDLKLELNILGSREAEIKTDVPFFNHLLTAMAFHGNFTLKITGTGDTDVDPHHLVEDIGLVLGDALAQTAKEYVHLARFGHSVIPMDDSLSEVTIDVCGRPFCFYKADYPQTNSGSFDMALLKEFFTALAGKACITIHAECRHGENSHHMAESLFKALGKAIKQAYQPLKDENKALSTKGVI